MKKSLEELIEVALKVQGFLHCGSFNLHRYDSGSYVEFTTLVVPDVKGLLNAASDLELRFFASDTSILVRLYEREDETDT